MDDNKIRLVVSEYSATGEGITIIMLASRGSDAYLLKQILQIEPYFGLGAEIVDVENIPPKIKAHLPQIVLTMLKEQHEVHFVWHSMYHVNAS